VKKLIALFFALQLVAMGAFAQTAKIQTLDVLGTSSFTGAATFTVRPTFNGYTPWDSGNLSTASFAPINSPVFTGTPTVPGYLTSTTYAPINSPTFTGTVTIPAGAAISGYLTTATAASTYAPLASPSFTGTVATAGTFSGAGTNLTGTATSLTAGTATKATNLSAGVANQIPYQTAANTTSFLAAPTVASTCLLWNGTAITWATCGSGSGGSGTVTSVAASGGATGMTFTGSPITSSGVLSLGGLLGVGYGGTGLASPTAHSVLISEGTSAMALATTGTAGNVLMDQGSGVDPKFQSLGLVTLTGADPTGSADSTTAIQNFVNTVVENGYRGSIPPGTYKISAAIVVPFGTGWTIQGNARGGTIINQTAANTQIFNLTADAGGVGGHSFAITDLQFQWATTPTFSQVHSIAVDFNNSSSTFFDFQLERLTCNNGYECIGIDSSTDTTVWGNSLRDIVVEGTACSAIDFSEGGTGQPNIEIDGFYAQAQSMTTSCPVINVGNNDGGWYNHIEVNAVPNGNDILYLTGQFAIGSVKVEDATYAANQYIYQFPNAHATIGLLSMEDLTINASGGDVVGIDINAGGTGSTVTVGNVMVTFNATPTGTFYLANDYGGSPTYNLRFINTPQGILGVTGAYLVDNPGAESDGGVSVDDWQQPRLTADKGNANSTWAIGNPNIIVYNTPLTAVRTVTLTDSATIAADSNLYNGFKVCVLRTIAATGNYALNIVNSAGTTVDSVPANGKACLMWNRSLGWVPTDYQTNIAP
jgi:hypothetical protein